MDMCDFYSLGSSDMKPNYLIVKQSLVTFLNVSINTALGDYVLGSTLDLKPSEISQLKSMGMVDVDGYRYLITILGYK